ncbi:hypothetical protein [Nonomuraea jabiensis]|uniref:Uncharacterized protein n=1 Tax=Nonomuraea jabiensis TaxID=882448 RepID=A0A7W9GE95_9ACTN|nr:hypothetical protein [Nonomuraea jabiensis]MBB5782122.1 hypothetical protein [Nonomuraea jabiensis]
MSVIVITVLTDDGHPAALRAVAQHAATAEVDVLVITLVFQSTEMHRHLDRAAGALQGSFPSRAPQA